MLCAHFLDRCDRPRCEEKSSGVEVMGQVRARCLQAPARRLPPALEVCMQAPIQRPNATAVDAGACIGCNGSWHRWCLQLRLDDCRAVLERLHKVVKPGGIVVIAFEWFWDAGVFPQQSVEHIGEVHAHLPQQLLHAPV